MHSTCSREKLCDATCLLLWNSHRTFVANGLGYFRNIFFVFHASTPAGDSTATGKAFLDIGDRMRPVRSGDQLDGKALSADFTPYKNV